jgi:peptide/nickel transport system permease protein
MTPAVRSAEAAPEADAVETVTISAATSRTRRTWASRVSLGLAVAVIVLILLWTCWPGAFTSDNPLEGLGRNKLLSPSARHPFGTDQLGRDLFTRVVYAASLSVRAAAIAVAIAFVAGSVLGLLAGFIGGWVDDVVMRIVDVMLAVPSILMSMALITVLGRGTVVVAVAVGVASVASVARTMRSEVLKVRQSDYVEASKAAGSRAWKTMFTHVLPNSSGPVIVLSTIEFGTALLSIAALSFLGYGEPPPTPEWGSLVSSGRDYMANAWWLVTAPGLVIVIVVLAINRISRSIQDFSQHKMSNA